MIEPDPHPKHSAAYRVPLWMYRHLPDVLLDFALGFYGVPRVRASDGMPCHTRRERIARWLQRQLENVTDVVLASGLALALILMANVAVLVVGAAGAGCAAMNHASQVEGYLTGAPLCDRVNGADTLGCADLLVCVRRDGQAWYTGRGWPLERAQLCAQTDAVCLARSRAAAALEACREG